MPTTEPHVWLTSDDGNYFVLINSAYAQISLLCTLGAVDFVSLTNETLKGALKVLYEAFFPHENVCCAVGLSEDQNGMKELEELTLNTARDGISIVAVERATGDVLGAAFNKLQVGNQL